MDRVANINKLDNIEKISRVHIIADKFSAYNGMLTSTHKLKRHDIKHAYQRELESLYNEKIKFEFTTKEDWWTRKVIVMSK